MLNDQDALKNYAAFQLNNLTEFLSRLTDGQGRNCTLHRYVCSLGWTIRAGIYSEQELTEHFIEVARECGLIKDFGVSSQIGTIERAIKSGKNNPVPAEAHDYSPISKTKVDLKKYSQYSIKKEPAEKTKYNDVKLRNKGYDIKKIYPFYNDDGEMVYEKVRYEKTGGEKRFLIRYKEGKDYFFGKNNSQELPYNNIELCSPERLNETVFIMEGEKDSDSGIQCGLLATSVQDIDKNKNSFIDRNCIIIFDNDDAGLKRGERTAKTLIPFARTVKLVRLPYVHTGEDFTDWIKNYTLETLHDVISETNFYNISKLSSGNNLEEEYEIVHSKPNEILNTIDKIISHTGLIFNRSGQVIQLVSESTATNRMPLEIRNVQPGRIVYLVHNSVSLVEQRRQDIVPTSIKSNHARMYLELGVYKHLKPLHSIINVPLLLSNNQVVIEPGYHEETGLYLDIEKDGWENTDDPLKVIMEPFKEFPFASEMDKAMYLGALITSVIRHNLPYSPAFIINATEQGSGKTLLASCINMLSMGTDASLATYSDKTDENNKCIDGFLLQGLRIVIFDNINRAFGSDKICSILTSANTRVRELGSSQTYTLKNTFMLIATGNGITLFDDMGRRSCIINLNANMETPQSRKFDFDPLLLVKKKRKQITAAIFQAVRAARNSGVKAKKLGSYEDWGVVADTVKYLTEIDITEPLRNPVIESANSQKLRQLLVYWFDNKCGVLKAADIVKHMKTRYGKGEETIAELGDLIGFKEDARRIGGYLAKHTGQHRSGLKLEAIIDKKRGNKYQVVTVG